MAARSSRHTLSFTYNSLFFSFVLMCFRRFYQSTWTIVLTGTLFPHTKLFKFKQRVMWSTGIEYSVKMTFRIVNKHWRTLCYLVAVCCTVYIFRSGMIPPRLNDSCPPLVLANDIGRFGYKFFEYLASILVAQVLHRDVYVTISFANLDDRYFSGRKSLKITSEGVWSSVQIGSFYSRPGRIRQSAAGRLLRQAFHSYWR